MSLVIVVGGCPYGDPDDPGNLELDWLEVQLKEYMDRGMQVWVTGHVPPSPGNYFPECVRCDSIDVGSTGAVGAN